MSLPRVSPTQIIFASFDGIAGNPVESQVVAGADEYRAHDADGIVGVGGGAAALVSIAEFIALTTTHTILVFNGVGLSPQVSGGFSQVSTYRVVEVVLGVIIGTVSFSGSAIAFASADRRHRIPP